MTDFQSATANELPAAAPAPKVRSAAADAWRDLRRSPIFWIASVLVVIVLLMAIAPRIFTPNNPGDCVLSRQYAPGTGWALFGYDFQGCDIYARAVYGARASLLVGGASALLTGLIAMIVGMAAGFFGGWADAILSRVTDIVLGIPLLLAAIVLMKRISNNDQWFRLFAVVFVLAVLGWTTAARVIRSSVISAKQQDYVAAARMLGASDARIMWRHILPNSLAPFIVVLTIALGSFISAEATLSFLGIGLQAPTVSWGIDIDTGRTHMRDAAMPLVVPSAFLALTVLAFIMLGDAIRDAFDPKLR